MKSKFKRTQYFILLTMLFLIMGTSICLNSNKIELHLKTTQYHNHFFDIFFKNITTIGDGAFALILLPYLIFYTKSRNFLLSLSTCLLAGILAQFFKKVIFTDMYRPAKLIAAEKLHTIEGVHLHTAHAFPSGHTTSAFALFILFSYLFGRSKSTQFVFAFMAIIVGFSRVYLSQHFLGDVLFGAFLGTISFVISFKIISSYNHKFLNKSIIHLIFPSLESSRGLKSLFNSKN